MEPEVQFLDYVVKAIVDHPESVKIERSVDNFGVLLTLTVHKDDMGKVIGKGGKIATLAIRPLVHIVGLKHNARVSVKIPEPSILKQIPMDKSLEDVLSEVTP